MKEKFKQTLRDLAEPLVRAQGLEIWGIEILGNPPNKAILYIDARRRADEGEASEVGEAAVTIEQCEEISRQLGLGMDVADEIPGPWTLEVSSPGLERKFFAPDQLKPYVGALLELGLHRAQGGAPLPGTMRGRLLSAEDGVLEIEPRQIDAAGEDFPAGAPIARVPWSACRSVRLCHVFKRPRKPGKKALDSARSR